MVILKYVYKFDDGFQKSSGRLSYLTIYSRMLVNVAFMHRMWFVILLLNHNVNMFAMVLSVSSMQQINNSTRFWIRHTRSSRVINVVRCVFGGEAEVVTICSIYCCFFYLFRIFSACNFLGNVYQVMKISCYFPA